MSQSITDIFLAGNAKWRPTWKTPPTMEQIRKIGSAPNNPLMIVTCMDPRCEPSQFLGGEVRFAAVKNAGGRATPDALRSILTLRSLNTVSNGGTVAVIHHTDCGMTHLTDEAIKHDIAQRTPEQAARGNAIDFGTFRTEEFEDVIKKDVQVLKDEKLLEGMDILGFAFITETGELRRVI